MSKSKKKLPQNDEMAIRSFGVPDFRALEDESIIEGHAAVYDQRTNMGYFYEVIERGAFDDCDFDDVGFFVNHNMQKIPLARSRRNNGNSTMLIKPDDKGLYVRAKLDTERNPEASSLYSAVKRGDIDGMSFGFYVKEARWENLDSDMPTRYISKFRKVFDVSAVNMPAYTGTDISVRDQRALDNAAMVLENARAELDNSKNEQVEVLKLRNQILMKG